MKFRIATKLQECDYINISDIDVDALRAGKDALEKIYPITHRDYIAHLEALIKALEKCNVRN
jgi:hypothetical protein